MMNNFLNQTELELRQCKKMADEIAEKFPINEALFKAFCSVPREIFCSLKAQAYKLEASPMMLQWLSSPLTVAKMTMALDFDEADSVLEVGCGSGYQAAILSQVIRRVFTIERIEKLANGAKRTFKELELNNIFVLHADGQLGWARYAPYDRILFSAYAQNIPQALFEQLNENGILVAPVLDKSKQFITKFTKTASGIRKEVLDECLFVPILDGKE